MSQNFSETARKTLSVQRLGEVSYYALSELEKQGFCSVATLPFSLRVLLESILRNYDGGIYQETHVRELAAWKPQALRKEIPFMPARVVLQDFTGVPAIVDLAAMRDKMKEEGGSAQRINPFVPCDLVIDHSVQVDYFGTKDAQTLNEELEFKRNAERYRFLKWGQQAFDNLRVIPPATGIIHQVNLEYLSQGVFLRRSDMVVYPDSCVGTDSHTPMVNGLGVLAWGVGGIEAEAIMLGQPIFMLTPDVVGVCLHGALREGVTATDLVLSLTQLCRKIGVVGKFVEFYGKGVSSLSIADRATISNMAPEQGATVSYFPVDAQTIAYLRSTGRSDEMVNLAEQYAKAQLLWYDAQTESPHYSQSIDFDLSSVEPSVAGPKRPHDKHLLSEVSSHFAKALTDPISVQGFELSDQATKKTARISNGSAANTFLSHGDVVIAAITSCTNTSNPAVMIAAGLVAKKAVQLGLKSKPYVKTSLAPGSTVVTEYLQTSGLLPYLEELGFFLVGYGCTTCIGNSGPLAPEVEDAIKEGDLVVSAVLSGNRNFEGRVHPFVRANFLASPPLVVAYSLLGTLSKDITTEPLGLGSSGEKVYLRDVWPSSAEIDEVLSRCITQKAFVSCYKDVSKGSARWQEIELKASELYAWDSSSTYIRKPPFFEPLCQEAKDITPIYNARVLGLFGDFITTDHISPAGSIASGSPAARYLEQCGVAKDDFNSYGARRGNHELMMRGTFANIRLKNLLVKPQEGNLTKHFPSGEKLSFFDAAERYRQDGISVIIIAGKEYGSGSSRDWAAKGPYLLGVKAVIAESFERIHRSNLVGMGILPLQFVGSDNAASLGLTGEEEYRIELDSTLCAQTKVKVVAASSDRSIKEFYTLCRIDTPVEVEYFRNGGILCAVLKKLMSQSK